MSIDNNSSLLITVDVDFYYILKCQTKIMDLINLRMKSIRSQLDYLKSDFEYKQKMVENGDKEFLKMMNEVLDENPELKKMYIDKENKMKEARMNEILEKAKRDEEEFNKRMEDIDPIEDEENLEDDMAREEGLDSEISNEETDNLANELNQDDEEAILEVEEIEESTDAIDDNIEDQVISEDIDFDPDNPDDINALFENAAANDSDENTEEEVTDENQDLETDTSTEEENESNSDEEDFDLSKFDALGDNPDPDDIDALFNRS
jgi:hypothetical protein